MPCRFSFQHHFLLTFSSCFAFRQTLQRVSSSRLFEAALIWPNSLARSAFRRVFGREFLFFFLQGCHVLLGQDFSFGCYCCCCADFAFALLFRGVVAQKSNISERQLNASDSRLFTQNVEFVELEFLLFAKGSSLPAQPSPSHFAGGRWQLLVGFQNKKTGQTNVCCPFAAAQMFT